MRFRAVLIGDSNVGKTSLLTKAIDEIFDPEQKSTIGGNFNIYGVEYEGKQYDFQIWDTAGQEKYKSLGPIYYQGSNAAIAVFDVTNKTSFNNVNDWIKSFHEVVGFDSVVIVVGNKVDLLESATNDENIVTELELQEFTKKNGYLAIITSAKTGQGVNELFLELLKSLLEKNKTNISVHDSQDLNSGAEKKCC